MSKRIQRKIQDILAGMSPRDRLLALGLVVVFGATAISGSIVVMSKTLTDENTLAQNQDLNSIQVMQAERRHLGSFK